MNECVLYILNQRVGYYTALDKSIQQVDSHGNTACTNAYEASNGSNDETEHGR